MLEIQYAVTFNYSPKQQEKFLQTKGATLSEKVKNFIPEDLPDDGSREFFALTTLAQIPHVFPDYFAKLPKSDPCVRCAKMAQILRKLYHKSDQAKIDYDLVWQTVIEAMQEMGLNPHVKKNVIERAALTPTSKELKRAEKNLATIFEELSTPTPAQLVHPEPDEYTVARLGIYARADKNIVSAYDYFFGKSLNPRQMRR